MVGSVNSTWDVYVLTRGRPIYYLYKGQLSPNSTKKNQVFVIQLTSLRDNLLFEILWGNLGYTESFITLKQNYWEQHSPLCNTLILWTKFQGSICAYGQWYLSTSKAVPYNTLLSTCSNALVLSPTTPVPLPEPVVQMHVMASAEMGTKIKQQDASVVQTALPQSFLQPAHSSFWWWRLSSQTGTHRLALSSKHWQGSWKSKQGGSFPGSATKSKSCSKHKCLQIYVRDLPLRLRCWHH